MNEPDQAGFLRRLFVGHTSNLWVQLLRYTQVGGLAFLVDFGTLFLLTDGLGIHYLISAAVAFLLGLITNYFLSTSWVFSQRTLSSRPVEFGIFTAIGLIGLGMNELNLWILVEKLNLHYLVSKMASTVVVYLWNFFARKYVLFR